MADEGAPIGFAPVAAGEYPPGGTGDERVRCLLVGAAIGQQSMFLEEALATWERTREGQTGIMRDAFIRDFGDTGRKMEELLTEAVKCGLDPTGGIARAWGDVDRSVGALIDGMDDAAAARSAHDDAVEFVRTYQREGNKWGVDPPLLRNVRRYAEYNATRPRRAEK